MAILPIRLFGDPALREPGRPVTSFDDDLRRLADDMIDTMYAAHGAGLAAPQVGVARALFVYDAGDGPQVVVNPELSDPEGEFTMEEGCLSLPDVFIEITRPDLVTARFQDEYGRAHEQRASGFEGRVYQHEKLHLDGRWFFDDAPRAAKKPALRRIRELMADGVLSYVPDPDAAHDEAARL